jgi:hypothetical protein
MQPNVKPGWAAVKPIDAGQEGMSIRDYFAGQALTGFIANPHYLNHGYDQIAAFAYRTADELLKERAK